ncbi:hypothetical protein DMENIID0001_106440 [Sergentomyia squamirostris]
MNLGIHFVCLEVHSGNWCDFFMKIFNRDRITYQPDFQYFRKSKLRSHFKLASCAVPSPELWLIFSAFIQVLYAATSIV